jgi:hypothetical protein
MMQPHEQRTKEKTSKPSRISTEEERMDDAIEASFPASDPSTSPMTTGAPKDERNADRGGKKKAHSRHE